MYNTKKSNRHSLPVSARISATPIARGMKRPSSVPWQKTQESSVNGDRQTSAASPLTTKSEAVISRDRSTPRNTDNRSDRSSMKREPLDSFLPDRTPLTDEGDDVDEISLLGMLDFPDTSGNESVLRETTPMGYLMKPILKSESPTYTEIVFTKHDTETVGDPALFVRELPMDDPDTDTARVATPFMDKSPRRSLTPQGLSAASESSDGFSQEPFHQEVPMAVETITDIFEVQLDNSSPQSLSRSKTPDRLLPEQEVAQTSKTPTRSTDEIYQLNTPARPMEDLSYLLDSAQVTPQRPPPAAIHRTPPHKQDAFLETLISPSTTSPAVSTSRQAQDANEESFASTVEDFAIRPPILPVRPKLDDETRADRAIDRELDSDLRHMTPNSARSSPALNVNNNSSNSRTLGSAIRIVKTKVHSAGTPVLPDDEKPLIVKDSKFSLLTPKTFNPILPNSAPVEYKRPSTPPYKKRYSMDVPLHRTEASVELWEDYRPLIKLSTTRSPSPESEASLATPPPRTRQLMDVPLPRLHEAKEIWQGQMNQRMSRPNRRLLSSPPQKSPSSSEMMVEETPEIHVDVEVATSTTTFEDRFPNGLPAIPKLNFSVHQSELDRPKQRTINVDADDTTQNLKSDTQKQTPHVNFVEMESQQGALPSGRAKRYGINATPRSSNLRLLAHRLAERATTDIPYARPQENYSEEDLFVDMLTSDHDSEERAARRKQLSDDISLDFGTAPSATPKADPISTVVQDPEGVPSPVSVSLARSDDSEESEPVPSYAMVSTPVFTRRKVSRIFSPDAESILDAQLMEDTHSLDPEPEPELESESDQEKRPESKPEEEPGSGRELDQELMQGPKSEQETAPASNAQTRRKPKKHYRTNDLTMFGTAPLVLPRERRERKKPVEFWRIGDKGVASSNRDDSPESETSNHLKRKQRSNYSVVDAADDSQPKTKKVKKGRVGRPPTIRD